jgi:small conductance mechanosensitive channel
MSDVLKGFIEGLLGSSQLSALERLGSLAAKLTLAVLIAALALFVAGRTRNGIQHVFRRNKGDLGLAILLGRIAYFTILTIGILLILPLFGLSATALLAALGVLGLAVSLAMQDVLKNVFAGVYLLIERPFRPGETIKVRDFVGTVETVELRTTTLRADGEVVYIPNAILFGEVLVNRGKARQVAVDENPE